MKGDKAKAGHESDEITLDLFFYSIEKAKKKSEQKTVVGSIFLTSEMNCFCQKKYNHPMHSLGRKKIPRGRAGQLSLCRPSE